MLHSSASFGLNVVTCFSFVTLQEGGRAGATPSGSATDKSNTCRLMKKLDLVYDVLMSLSPYIQQGIKKVKMTGNQSAHNKLGCITARVSHLSLITNVIEAYFTCLRDISLEIKRIIIQFKNTYKGSVSSNSMGEKRAVHF